MRILVLTILFLINSFEINAQNIKEYQKVNASHRTALDLFGNSIVVENNTSVIGSYYEELDANGANSKTQAGAVYFFTKGGNGFWNESQKITASDRKQGNRFGVDIDINGSNVIAGSYFDYFNSAGQDSIIRAGSAYFFSLDTTGQWVEKQKVVAFDRDPHDYFGFQVRVSGSYALIGAYREDHDENDTNYISNSGSAYLYKQDTNGTWNFLQKVVASDRSADDEFSRTLDFRGNVAAIGSYKNSLDSTGSNSVLGAGAVYIFEEDSNGLWYQKQKITPSSRSIYDYFGYSVSLNGNLLFIGAIGEDEDEINSNTLNNAGLVYIYERNSNGFWSEKQKITASDRSTNFVFGTNIASLSDRAIIGAYRVSTDLNGQNALTNAGAAYLFEEDSTGSWNEVQKIVLSDRMANDNAGTSVALNSTDYAMGVKYQDSDSTGSNSLTNSGAAHFFKLCPPNYDSLIVQICDSFSLPGSDTVYYASGVYTEYMTNQNGCDSTVTIDLTIDHGFYQNVLVEACNSYTSPSGLQIYTSSGFYLDSLQTATGCDSVYEIDLTINNSTQSSFTENVCDIYVSPSGKVIKTSGVYNDTLGTSKGCDSIMTIAVNITKVDSNVIKNGNTLTAVMGGANYQWVSCNSNYAPIGGETNKSFTASVGGLYAVIVSFNGCKDTSACFQLGAGDGFDEYLNELILKLFPNPSDGQITLTSNGSSDVAFVAIYNSIGSVVYRSEKGLFADDGSASFNLRNLNAGIYTVVLVDDDRSQSVRMIIEK